MAMIASTAPRPDAAMRAVFAASGFPAPSSLDTRVLKTIRILVWELDVCSLWQNVRTG